VVQFAVTSLIVSIKISLFKLFHNATVISSSLSHVPSPFSIGESTTAISGNVINGDSIPFSNILNSNPHIVTFLLFSIVLWFSSKSTCNQIVSLNHTCHTFSHSTKTMSQTFIQYILSKFKILSLFVAIGFKDSFQKLISIGLAGLGVIPLNKLSATTSTSFKFHTKDITFPSFTISASFQFISILDHGVIVLLGSSKTTT
jgi:hypothetical protein